MIRILAALFAVVLTLFFTLPARADDYVDPFQDQCVEGFITPFQQFVYHSGLWWKNGISHRRKVVYSTATSGYGCSTCSYQTSDVIYYPYSPPVVAAAIAPTYKAKLAYEPGWEKEAFRVLDHQNDLVAHGNALATLTANAIQPNGYMGVSANYGHVSGSTYYQRGNLAQLNTSLYGLKIDLDAMSLQRDRALKRLGELHGQVATNEQALNSQLIQGSIELAKIEAIGKAFQNVSAPPTVQASTFNFSNDDQPTVQPMPPADPIPVQAQSRQATPEFAAFWAQRCAACHTGATAQHGFTLDKYLSLSRKDKEQVFGLVDSADDSVRMPKVKTASGFGPGVKLTAAERLPLTKDILASK
jgi:hypothetical protein